MPRMHCEYDMVHAIPQSQRLAHDDKRDVWWINLNFGSHEIVALQITGICLED